MIEAIKNRRSKRRCIWRGAEDLIFTIAKIKYVKNMCLSNENRFNSEAIRCL